eukprot:gene4373-4956_t
MARAQLRGKHAVTATEKITSRDAVNNEPRNKSKSFTQLQLKNQTQAQTKALTRASVNIMDENSFTEINRKTGTPIKLKQSKVRVYAYGSKTPLEMMGEFEETIETNQRITLAKFHVAKKVQGNLLSSTTAENLNLIKININHVQEKETKEEQKKPNPHDPAANIKSEEYVSHLLDKHSNVFKGVGTLKNLQYNPPDDENIQITNPDSEVESSDDENETEIEHKAVHQYPQRIRRMP